MDNNGARIEFGKAVKRAAYFRSCGYCEGCGRELAEGDIEYDHEIPAWMGGAATLDNCKCICKSCHKLKTKRDVKNIAKSKRLQDKRIKARKPKGRPILGSKRSGLRKRMDGTVERR
jgi:5-methylcytosine-specific restriction endonuclease McrA